MKRLDFCTSLSIGGIPKMITLLGSIEAKVSKDYRFWVLCENDEIEKLLFQMKLRNVILVRISEVEKKFQGLIAIKHQRDPFEYNCTIRAAWIHFVMDSNDEIECVNYVDSDLFFFKDPAPLYEGLKENSVLLTPHRLSSLARSMGIKEEVVGRFNAGWLAFKNDVTSRKLLGWWHEQCLVWCYRTPSLGRFGEQKYLEEFPKLSHRVSSLEAIGANVGPWNMNDYKFWQNESGVVMIDREPIYFFHFHALKIPGESSFKVEAEIGSSAFQLTNPSYVVTRNIMRFIYQPYLRELGATIERLGFADSDLQKRSGSLNFSSFSISPKSFLISSIARLRLFLIDVKLLSWRFIEK